MEKCQKLSKAEMKNVIGGVAQQKYNCQCEGTKGTWTGNYSSQASADADAAASCRYGGSCGLA